MKIRYNYLCTTSNEMLHTDVSNVSSAFYEAYIDYRSSGVFVPLDIVDQQTRLIIANKDDMQEIFNDFDVKDVGLQTGLRIIEKIETVLGTTFLSTTRTDILDVILSELKTHTNNED